MIRRIKKGLDFPVSPYVSSYELDCGCGNPECKATFFSTELLEKFELLRAIWDEPIIINSGYRCILHNKEVGGADLSTHMVSLALDLQIPKTIDMFWFKYEASKLFEFVYLHESSRSIHLDIFKRG